MSQYLRNTPWSSTYLYKEKNPSRLGINLYVTLTKELTSRDTTRFPILNKENSEF